MSWRAFKGSSGSIITPMETKNVHWRAWVIGGFVVVVLFVWASEVFDLPHLLMRAPNTPINWQESLLESVVTILAGAISWALIARYERNWQEALQELRHLASTDDLTGALNRRECLARAEAEFNRSLRFERPLSIAIIDFDNFKQVNDLFGHPVGDDVLKGFGDVVRSNIRAQDLFGRMGGDEFLVAFIEATPEEATEITERIRDRWSRSKIASPADGQTATISAGLSSLQAIDQSLMDCIRRADKALYTAKFKGRDRIQWGNELSRSQTG